VSADATGRVAVMADIHGNVMALDAVLAEMERDPPRAVIVVGDVASGPHPRQVIDRLRRLPAAQFVRGNADREVVEAFDHAAEWDAAAVSPAQTDAIWVAQRLGAAERDFLAGFQERVVLTMDGLGEVLFCHGSPRSDEEIMTSLTPAAAVRAMLAGVTQRTVVCGHTHVQFDRRVDTIRIINAGSVGMAYEGRRGAFWLTLGDRVEFQHSEYDYEQAATQIRASAYADAEHFAGEVILNPPQPGHAEAFFEQLATNRGERA
jgi:predicted phosphodiesterase